MKKLVLIALALCTFTLSAQPGNPSRNQKKGKVEKMKDWTPEQKAELSTKKLALELNLTEAQQEKIYPIQLQILKDRAEMRATKKEQKELSSDELFNLQNARLEKQLKTKEQLKSILTTEQFEKWEKKHAKKNRNRKGKRLDRKRKN